MPRLSIIMLAGSLKPSPLRAGIDEPALRMPLRSDYRLLDAWLDAISGVDAEADVRIVVSELRDIDTLNNLLSRQCRQRIGGRKIGVIREPRAWRGTAGLIRDMAESMPPDSQIAVLEAGCLPLVPVNRVMEAMTPEHSGVIVAGRDREPAGIYLFRRTALDMVSSVGYADMKEQFIPMLHQHHMKIRLVECDQPVVRIRDRRNYLAAIAGFSLDGTDGEEAGSQVDPAARVLGRCVIERGAVVEAGGVIHESVLLSGARVGSGAVVSRSIIGRGFVVGSTERIIEQVLSREGVKTSSSEPALAG